MARQRWEWGLMGGGWTRLSDGPMLSSRERAAVAAVYTLLLPSTLAYLPCHFLPSVGIAKTIIGCGPVNPGCPSSKNQVKVNLSSIGAQFSVLWCSSREQTQISSQCPSQPVPLGKHQELMCFGYQLPVHASCMSP